MDPRLAAGSRALRRAPYCPSVSPREVAVSERVLEGPFAGLHAVGMDLGPVPDGRVVVSGTIDLVPTANDGFFEAMTWPARWRRP